MNGSLGPSSWLRQRSGHHCRRPLLHALVSPGVAAGFGVEVDAVKCDKAAPFLSRCEAALRQRRVTTAALPVPAVQCAPVEQVGNQPLPSCTLS